MDLIVETCNALHERWGEKIPGVLIECFDAIGNGLFWAQAERLPKEEWGDTAAFLNIPLSQCDVLPGANSSAVWRCYIGVFTTLFEIARSNFYGFAYDKNRPFALCTGLTGEWQRSCYFNATLMLDGKITNNPVELSLFVQKNVPEHLHGTVFKAGTFPISQGEFSKEKIFSFLKECSALPQKLFQTCVGGVLQISFLNGPPEERYFFGDEVCKSEIVGPGENRTDCMNKLARVNEMYVIEKAEQRCFLPPGLHLLSKYIYNTENFFGFCG